MGCEEQQYAYQVNCKTTDDVSINIVKYIATVELGNKTEVERQELSTFSYYNVLSSPSKFTAQR